MAELAGVVGMWPFSLMLSLEPNTGSHGDRQIFELARRSMPSADRSAHSTNSHAGKHRLADAARRASTSWRCRPEPALGPGRLHAPGAASSRINRACSHHRRLHAHRDGCADRGHREKQVAGQRLALPWRRAGRKGGPDGKHPGALDSLVGGRRYRPSNAYVQAFGRVLETLRCMEPVMCGGRRHPRRGCSRSLSGLDGSVVVLWLQQQLGGDFNAFLGKATTPSARMRSDTRVESLQVESDVLALRRAHMFVGQLKSRPMQHAPS